MPFLRMLLSVALCLSFAPAALAHARLLRSVPAKDAQMTQAPGQVELWFNELLDDGFNTIAVFPAEELAAPKRTNLVKSKPVVDSRDRTHLTVPLPPLAPGDYILEWRVLSRDGHSAPGRLNFRVLAR